MKKIAVAGLGIMGRGIVDNYLKNGYDVFVWNRTPEKLKHVITKGAIEVSTPKEAAEKADIIFEVTANDESSRSVWLGEYGILAGARPESILITSATLSVKWIDELSGECAKKDFTFFDMPLTGGRSGAESGSLILLVGGDEEKLQGIKQYLEAISKEQLYFGKAGAGMHYKLLLNMLQAIHVCALGEVLAIADKVGLDVGLVGNALTQRPGGTTTNLAWRDYQKIPDPINFSVQWIAKDLNYAKEMADYVDLPLLNDVIKKYSEALEKGMGGHDWTAVTHF